MWLGEREGGRWGSRGEGTQGEVGRAAWREMGGSLTRV